MSRGGGWRGHCGVRELEESAKRPNEGVRIAEDRADHLREP